MYLCSFPSAVNFKIFHNLDNESVRQIDRTLVNSNEAGPLCYLSDDSATLRYSKMFVSWLEFA